MVLCFVELKNESYQHVKSSTPLKFFKQNHFKNNNLYIFNSIFKQKFLKNSLKKPTNSSRDTQKHESIKRHRSSLTLFYLSQAAPLKHSSSPTTLSLNILCSRRRLSDYQLKLIIESNNLMILRRWFNWANVESSLKIQSLSQKSTAPKTIRARRPPQLFTTTQRAEGFRFRL